jgi:hypothetical protein
MLAGPDPLLTNPIRPFQTRETESVPAAPFGIESTETPSILADVIRFAALAWLISPSAPTTNAAPSINNFKFIEFLALTIFFPLFSFWLFFNPAGRYLLIPAGTFSKKISFKDQLTTKKFHIYYKYVSDSGRKSGCPGVRSSLFPRF